jgi:hypothetical protein
VSFRNYKNVEDPRGLWVRVGEKRRCALREARYEMSGGCGVPLRKGTARGCIHEDWGPKKVELPRRDRGTKAPIFFAQKTK